MPGSGSQLGRMLRVLASCFGFSRFDEERTRRGLVLAALLVVTGWGLFLFAPLIGVGAATGGLGAVTLGFFVLAGGLLNASKANVELATLLVTGLPQMQAASAELKAKPAAVAVDPMPTLSVNSAEPPPLPSPAATKFVPPPVPQRRLQHALPAGPAAAPRKVLTEGQIDGRSYLLFSDGSIEMDTVFGARWFASVELAHEFIGYKDGNPNKSREFAARLN